MKYLFALISTVLLALPLSVTAAALAASDSVPEAALSTGDSIPEASLSASAIVSETAVLMDADTGQVLFDKGMHRRMFPASTTKVMTALLVCENADPAEVVTISEDAAQIDEWGSSHIALQPGEQVTVDDLLYALMLPSANDAANALAEHVGGSQKKFAEMMTARAAEIGAVDTHFTNAHGLHDSAHYTTTHDMALLTAYAMQNPLFRKYFGADLHTMAPTNLQADERYFTNMQHMLVNTTSYYNKDVLGGKVGYTKEAGHTMTTVARRGDRTLICVVMRSTNRWEKFRDTQALLEYGFTRFRSVTLPAERFTSNTVPVGEDEVTFYSDSDFTALLRNDIDEDQIRVNYRLPERFETDTALPASVEVVIDTSERTLPTTLGTQPLLNDLPLTNEDAVLATAPIIPAKPSRMIPVADSLSWIVPATVAIVLLLAAGFFIVSHYQLQKRRRKRLEQLRRSRGKNASQKSA